VLAYFLSFFTFTWSRVCVQLVSHLLLIFYDTANILQCELSFHGTRVLVGTLLAEQVCVCVLSIQYAQQSITCFYGAVSLRILAP